MALYNNGYPMSYQQYYPQYQQGAQVPSTNQQQGIIWVQGEAGAKSYLVAPNTTVQLWDSESQTIYLKSADASGMPSIKTLDYIIRDSATTKQTANNDFLSRQEFNNLTQRIDTLEAKLKEISKDAQSDI